MNYFIYGVVVGAILATIVSLIFYRMKRMGILNIDDSDPDKTKYGIEITTDLDKLAHKSSCVLKIRSKTSN